MAECECTGGPPGTAPLCGWLTKEGGRWKSWRRRFFVLEPPLLRYFKREGDHEPAGTINLASSGHIRGVAHRGVRNAFQIQTPSRTYVMYAASAAARDAWVEGLNAALAALHPVALRRAAAPSDFELVKLVRKIDARERLAQVRARSTGALYTMRTLELADNAAARAWVERHSARLLVLQNLPHPFLANVQYCFPTHDRYYLLTDDVSGTPLADLLNSAGVGAGERLDAQQQQQGQQLERSHGLSAEAVRFYGAEVCLALGHLHQAGSAWPQVCPEQIVVTAAGHVCLRSQERLGAGCRADYRAPELLLRADAPYTCTCDWWCFGCLLFELLTGNVCVFFFPSFLLSRARTHHPLLLSQAPFHGESDEELAQCISAGVAAAPGAAALPEDARDLVARLLEPQAERRLADCDGVKAHAFFERINFEDLYKKQIQPPPLPTAAATAAAAATPGGEPPSGCSSNSGSSSTAADLFAGFTFVTSRVS